MAGPNEKTVLVSEKALRDFTKSREADLDLLDEKGVLKEMVEDVGKARGLVQQLDSQVFSATSTLMTLLNASKKVFGDIGEQLINYDEGVRRSVNGNKALSQTLIKNKDEIFALSKTTAHFGVASRENLQTALLLGQQNIKMLPIYRNNITTLVDFTARMSAFGVSTEESTSLLGSLTSNLDMTEDQLDSTRRKLVSFATQTGQSVKEVVKTYSASIGKFMDFLDPDEMNKNFMQFQTMARRMNTEVSSLYDMALKFDTMEGAQQTGARLNQTFSALGIEFNSLALQEMEPKERIDYISEKTREALSKARQMGGREGRLIMASLRDSGLYSSNEMIRGMEAEGGLRRATTDYDLGAPLQVMDRDQEAAAARRYNFTKVERAEAEERAAGALRMTQSYKIFQDSVSDFGGSVLELSAGPAKFKQAFLEVTAMAADPTLAATMQRARNLARGGEMSPEAQAFAEQMGLENVKTIKDLFTSLEKLDMESMKKIVQSGIGNVIGGAIISGVNKAVEDASRKMGIATPPKVADPIPPPE